MSPTVRQWRSDGLVVSGDGAGVESIGSTNHEISTVVSFSFRISVMPSHMSSKVLLSLRGKACQQQQHTQVKLRHVTKQWHSGFYAPQTEHLNGLTSECLSECVTRCSFCAAEYPQPGAGHTNGRSPV